MCVEYGLTSDVQNMPECCVRTHLWNKNMSSKAYQLRSLIPQCCSDFVNGFMCLVALGGPDLASLSTHEGITNRPQAQLSHTYCFGSLYIDICQDPGTRKHLLFPTSTEALPTPASLRKTLSQLGLSTSMLEHLDRPPQPPRPSIHYTMTYQWIGHTFGSRSTISIARHRLHRGNHVCLIHL